MNNKCSTITINSFSKEKWVPLLNLVAIKMLNPHQNDLVVSLPPLRSVHIKDHHR